MSASFERGAEGDVPVLCVRGEIDLANAHELDTALWGLAGEGDAATVDLSALEYLDSAGIKVLFEHAGRVRLRVRLAPDSIVAAAIRASRLDGIAAVEATARTT
ncbi:MAG: STAS domain-containing protein [Solirubrobacteraceae bacterium]